MRIAPISMAKNPLKVYIEDIPEGHEEAAVTYKRLVGAHAYYDISRSNYGPIQSNVFLEA